MAAWISKSQPAGSSGAGVTECGAVVHWCGGAVERWSVGAVERLRHCKRRGGSGG